MSDSQQPEQMSPYERTIRDYLASLDGETERPSLEELDRSTRLQVEGIVELVDASWNSCPDMSPFEEDPIAIALGFVTEPTVRVSGDRVRQARTRIALNVQQLSERIQAAGFELSLKELVHLERAAATELSPNVVDVLAREFQRSSR